MGNLMGNAYAKAHGNDQAPRGVMKAKPAPLKTGKYYEMCYKLHNGDPGTLCMKAVKILFVSEDSNIIVLREQGSTEDVSYSDWQKRFTFTEIINPDVTPLSLAAFKALLVNHQAGMPHGDLYDILLNGNYIKGTQK